jgi:CBS domain-containing protein
MHTLVVRDLAVPKDKYTTISADSTLSQAVRRLQEAQDEARREDPVRHRDRAILVLDENGEIIGKLSMLNVLRGLLPRYDKYRGSRTSSKGATRVGSARSVIDAMERDAGLWKKPLANLVEKAASIRVRDLIRPFAEDEFIDEDASLDKALHQLITGRYQSLLVTRAGTIIGILRLTDIYDELSERLLAHEEARAHVTEESS